MARVDSRNMGFRMQGFAAHILLALGHSIVDVRSSGHPDIIAENGLGRIRVEVEADMQGTGGHLPTHEDLVGLSPQGPGDKGLYVAVVCSPYPRWIVVDAALLAAWHAPLPLPVLDSISNRKESEQWSALFESILLQHKERLDAYTYPWLAAQARQQAGLLRIS